MSYYIKIDIDDVKDVLYVARSIPDNVQLEQGQSCINAKSYLGIYSLDFNRPIAVIMDDDIKMRDKFEKWHCIVDDESSEDNLLFIWGMTSAGDTENANMYTMNDIDIIYDGSEKLFCLRVETSYVFDTKAAEVVYLRELLNAFTKYMDDNGLDKNHKFAFWFDSLLLPVCATSIEELYTNFRMFVEGYTALYKNDKERIHADEN